MVRRIWNWIHANTSRDDIEALYDLIGALRSEIDRLRSQIDDSNRP